jgi:hypothetical protein
VVIGITWTEGIGARLPWTLHPASAKVEIGAVPISTVFEGVVDGSDAVALGILGSGNALTASCQVAKAKRHIFILAEAMLETAWKSVALAGPSLGLTLL